MRFSGFGSTGLQGQNCPVPSPDIMGIAFTEGAHDAFCDCMYGSDPVLNERCKVKFAIGRSANLIAMPWTNTAPSCGLAARGLPGASGLCQQSVGLIDKAVEAIGKGVEDILAGGSGGTGGQLPHPAGTVSLTGGGTPSTSGYTGTRLQQLKDSVTGARLSVIATRNRTEPVSDIQAELDYLRAQAIAAMNAKASIPVPLLVLGGGVAIWALFFRNK